MRDYAARVKPTVVIRLTQMFENRNCKSGGFTLIELLVVISIIIILMGLLFPAFKGVQDQAKRVQAKNDVTQIVTAINAFYTEYGQYPCGAQGGPDSNDYFTAGDAVLMDNLRGQFGASGLNTKGISFLQPPIAKDPSVPRSGIGSIGSTAGIYFDPWGAPYRVKMDNNYNNQLENPYTANTGAGFSVMNLGTMIWSIGKDGKGATTGTIGNGGSKKSADSDDDVISWQ